MFDKILIANRGEIACRVIRTARTLGYRTVAVYSDADAQAPHVALADEAVRLGPASVGESYLRVDALLKAARRTGANALHPGYGFLSENAAFAQACRDAGIIFIGPPPAAIAAMGDKAAAKRRMLAANVPCAPGYIDADAGDAQLTEQAALLGYPLLVKAVAGGGGRGMRLVRNAGELAQALAEARREAQGAFGDSTLMLERLIEDGRHIEIQIFADAHGNAVHLGERDCSTQRRRQKVIEEAPSPALNPTLRAAMGRDAVAAALAVGYQGAGTVEFIVDRELRHYFLEMNTRLQVEHPVTEAITGFDLVEWQLRIAAGQPLTALIPGLQDDVVLRGHAIEARLYAEDPYAGFVPQTGRIAWWRPQHATAQAGVRTDDGVREGDTVTPFYDPMLAKLIVHGGDRDDAIRRLIAALDDSPLFGVQTNARFLRDLINHTAFKCGAITTGLLDQWAEQNEPLLKRPLPDEWDWALAAAASVLRDGPGWRPVSVSRYRLQLRCGDDTRALQIRVMENGAVEITYADSTHQVRLLEWRDGHVSYEIDELRRNAALYDDGAALHLAQKAACFVFDEPSLLTAPAQVESANHLRASLAGAVIEVTVQPGDRVRAGQQLVCVEAMKMELWHSACTAGVVLAVHAKVGAPVAAGALLVELASAEEP